MWERSPRLTLFYQGNDCWLWRGGDLLIRRLPVRILHGPPVNSRGYGARRSPFFRAFSEFLEDGISGKDWHNANKGQNNCYDGKKDHESGEINGNRQCMSPLKDLAC